VDFLEKSSEVYELVDPQTPSPQGKLAISFGKLGNGKNAREIRYSKYDKKDINPLRYELDLFIQSILNNNTPAVDGKQGVRALKVAKEILNSIEDHARIVNKYWNLADRK
jgi:predicted dehydrogenase